MKSAIAKAKKLAIKNKASYVMVRAAGIYEVIGWGEYQYGCYNESQYVCSIDEEGYVDYE